MLAKKSNHDEKPQGKRFIETAREIKTDERQKAFEKAFDAVTKVADKQD